MLNVWRDVSQHVGLSPAVQPWCHEQQSLTDRFMHYSQGQFSVDVIRSGENTGLLQERERLHAANRPMWVREVWLNCKGKRAAYARSVALAADFSLLGQSLQGLGNQALGSLLFSDPDVKRDQQQYAVLTVQSELIQCLPDEIQSQARRFYVRRALYHVRGQYLMVTELFLPQFIAELGAA